MFTRNDSKTVMLDNSNCINCFTSYYWNWLIQEQSGKILPLSSIFITIKHPVHLFLISYGSYKALFFFIFLYNKYCIFWEDCLRSSHITTHHHSSRLLILQFIICTRLVWKCKNLSFWFVTNKQWFNYNQLGRMRHLIGSKGYRLCNFVL